MKSYPIHNYFRGISSPRVSWWQWWSELEGLPTSWRSHHIPATGNATSSQICQQLDNQKRYLPTLLCWERGCNNHIYTTSLESVTALHFQIWPPLPIILQLCLRPFLATPIRLWWSVNHPQLTEMVRPTIAPTPCQDQQCGLRLELQCSMLHIFMMIILTYLYCIGPE